ncbi:MAG: hypothetical protein CMJ28_02205 [Phycisphaerae bacterium]|nr:hypothetical protein [Phycisphaerae bacterium]
MTFPTEGTILALQPHGEHLRGVTVDRQNSGVLSATVHELSQDVSAVLGLMAESDAVGVLIMLPGSSMVVRTALLPSGSDQELLPALAIQSEALLGSENPEYRVGRGLLQAAPGESNRIGLLTSWPAQMQSGPLAELAERTEVPIRWTTPAAGLAGLLGTHRPTGPLIHADTATGTATFAWSHAGGVGFRNVLLPAGPQWASAVGQAFQESAVGAGAPDSWAAAAGEALNTRLSSLDGLTTILPPEISSDLHERTGMSANNLTTHGLLLGALLIDPQAQGLAGLRDAMPAENPDFQTRVTEALSVPKTARLIVAIAALVLIFGPIVAAWSRLRVVESRNAELASMVQDADALERSLAHYDTLGNTGFSAVKVLSDLFTNLPRGIRVEGVRMNTRDASFSLTGKSIPDRSAGVSATDVIESMRQQLGQDRMYSRISLNWEEPDAFGHLEFTLAGRIDKPHKDVMYERERDFAAYSLAARMYPDAFPDETEEIASGNIGDSVNRSETADATIPEPAAPTEESDGSSTRGNIESRLNRPGLSGGESDTASMADAADRGGSTVDPNLIPQPLSLAQVEALSRDEITAEIKTFSTAYNLLRQNGASKEDNPQHGLFLQIQASWKDLRSELLKRSREGNNQ